MRGVLWAVTFGNLAQRSGEFVITPKFVASGDLP